MSASVALLLADGAGLAVGRVAAAEAGNAAVFLGMFGFFIAAAMILGYVKKTEKGLLCPR